MTPEYKIITINAAKTNFDHIIDSLPREKVIYVEDKFALVDLNYWQHLMSRLQRPFDDSEYTGNWGEDD